jgi:hypothetical protein
MDYLQECMDALRRTAPDAERVHLGEKWIDQYLHAAGNREVSLKRLLDIINKEAEQRPSEDIWITMQGYVQLLLWKIEAEELLPPREE